MIEILIVLLVLGAATVVFYPALSGAEDPVGIVKRRKSEAGFRTDDLAAMGVLVERKERVLRNLRELDTERAAGRLATSAYDEFKRRDEIEAAGILHEISALEVSMKAGKTGRKAGKDVAGRARWGTRLAWIGGVAAFAIILGITMSKAVAPRQAGGTITGTLPGGGNDAPQGGGDSPIFPKSNPERLKTLETALAKDSNNLKNLLEAGHLYLGEQRFNEAAQVTLKVLSMDTRSAEAHAHIALLLMAEAGTQESQDSAQIATRGALDAINQAIRLDPKLPEAWLFKGMVMMAGLQDQNGAVEAWEHYLTIAPADADTTRIAAMVRGFRRSQP